MNAYAGYILLACLSLLDLGLTALGLAAGGAELNPLPAAAWDNGFGAAVLVKAAALLGVLVMVRELVRGGHVREASGLMLAWCAVLSLVNIFSFAQLKLMGVVP